MSGQSINGFNAGTPNLVSLGDKQHGLSHSDISFSMNPKKVDLQAILAKYQAVKPNTTNVNIGNSNFGGTSFSF